MTTLLLASKYATIEAAMYLYREGMASLPQSYIDYHQQLAESHLHQIEEAGYEVCSMMMDTDGWCDGMQVLKVLAVQDDKVIELVWHDSNSKGEWFQKSPAGGSYPFARAKNLYPVIAAIQF